MSRCRFFINERIDDNNCFNSDVYIIDRETYDMYSNSWNDLIDLCKLLNVMQEDKEQLLLVIQSLRKQNAKLKGRLDDLGVEYFE